MVHQDGRVIMDGGFAGRHTAVGWEDLPPDTQETILGMVLADAPLAQLARLATLCKAMRAAYRERLAERLACIQECFRNSKRHIMDLYTTGWGLEVTAGLLEVHMAVPRDLIVSPPVCLPAEYLSIHQ
jgi:hypothetical protein